MGAINSILNSILTSNWISRRPPEYQITLVHRRTIFWWFEPKLFLKLVRSIWLDQVISQLKIFQWLLWWLSTNTRVLTAIIPYNSAGYSCWSRKGCLLAPWTPQADSPTAPELMQMLFSMLGTALDIHMVHSLTSFKPLLKCHLIK